MNRRICFTSLFILMAFAGISMADPIGGVGSSCGSCQGSIYWLEYNPANTQTIGTEKIYDVFLTIDTTHYSGTGSYIHAVAVKVASSDVIGDSSLVSAPSPGPWTLHDGGLNAGGCSGSGSGFICADDGTSAVLPFSGKYIWEFHYATTSALLTGPLGASIKAEYVNTDGNKVGALVSEDINLQSCAVGTCGGGGGGGGNVPEPTSIMLLGSAALFTGLKLRSLRRSA
jgi:hypothetical protein